MACAAYGTWSSLGLEILRCYNYKFYTNTPSSQIKSKKKKNIWKSMTSFYQKNVREKFTFQIFTDINIRL